MPRFTHPRHLVRRARHAARRAGHAGPRRDFSRQKLINDMTETVALKIVQRIATELSVQPRQVAAAVQLLDEGSTVPFIARYRKEATGNLDDTQLRQLEERL
ncbi:TPA: Tex-like N-terminal domain-containing protein, partial [Burkholderia multivorans]